MSKVRQVFEQGLNAIVGLAQVSKDVEALKQELTSLRNDLDWVRNRNKELDQAITEVRSQRDTAMRERDEARSHVAELEGTLRMANDTNSQHLADIEQLRSELTSTKADRDQAYDAWHKAEQAKEQAESKLKDIQDFAKSAFGLTEPKPEPVSTPEPVQPVIVEAAPVSDPATVWVYEDDPRFNWSRPYNWDFNSGKHRQSAA